MASQVTTAAAVIVLSRMLDRLWFSEARLTGEGLVVRIPGRSLAADFEGAYVEAGVLLNLAQLAELRVAWEIELWYTTSCFGQDVTWTLSESSRAVAEFVRGLEAVSYIAGPVP